MGDARVVYRSFSVLTSLSVVPDDRDEDHDHEDDHDPFEDPKDLEDDH